ncbi:cytochrome P450 71A1-like [Tasmannia lanceolata]|uniref:cytochrome P450 71A1-like n=1 Tax=Tasmannia lanceolata TaxID=3420 RepID=UPI004063CDB6
MALILVAILLLIVFFFYSLIHKNKEKSKSRLPSPTKLPIIGNLHQITMPRHRSLRALSLRHGPLMLVHLGPHPTIVASSADVAKEIMKTHDLAFSSRASSIMAKRLMYDGKDMAFATYGEYWRQAKKICVLHLLSTQRVEFFRFVREEEVTHMIEKIRTSSGAVNLSEILLSLTSNIVSRAAFGDKFSRGEGVTHGFRKLLGEFMELLGTFHVGDYFPSLSWIHVLNGLDARIRKNFEEFDGFLEEVIEEHVKTGGIGEGEVDFVDVLLGIQKDDALGFSLTKDHIKALVQDMFAAGTDTTYAALEWAMAELIRHPKVMKKAQQEIRRIIGEKSKITEDDTDEMNYLKSVNKEALRLHPPVPLLVPRESIEVVKIQGYDVPAKTRAIINAWAIGRDPTSWEEPEKFRPERFMNSCNPIDFKGQDFQLIPFGAGRRGCPGIQFTIPTIQLALANLLYHFDWELQKDASGGDLDMAEAYGNTVHKKYPLVLIAKPHFC